MNFIKNTVNDVINNNFKNVSNTLYCYEQGLEMGKEETLAMVINNLVELEIDIDMISKITNVPIESLKDM